MYSRREDSRLRVPSPAVSRRQYRPRDTRSAYSDDYAQDVRGHRARDPSPGGIGRLSTSAPTGGDLSPYHSWRSGYRYLDHSPSDDRVSYLYSQGTVSSSSRTRESFPRSRQSSSSYGGNYVNGETRSRGRPRSFPEHRQRGSGSYLTEPSPRHGYPQPRDGKIMHGSYEQVSPNSECEAVMASEDAARMTTGGPVEMLEGSYTWDDGYTWHSSLTCYLCAQLFRRPRILPCGHTFCSECLAQLKDESMRDVRKTPGSHASCTWEGRQKMDVTAQFVCPIPECRYSMRLINLSKWSTRNKTVAETVDAVRRMYENREDASTQTDITMDSVLVTIPRAFMRETVPPGGERGLMRRNSSSLVDRMVHRALSMDSLSRSYIPQQHVTWRSYAAMLGMHILQQVLHT